MARSVNLNWVLIAVLAAAAFGGAVGYLFGARQQNAPPNQNLNVNSNSEIAETVASPTPEPTIAEIVPPTPSPQLDQETSPSTQPSISASSPTPATEAVAPPAANSANTLMIPVVSVKKTDLQDTFTAARSNGRVHDANDIMAACGTTVVAAADGEIARFFDSVPGGITIYQRSADKRLMYYYAHLQRRADSVQPGQFVRQGTVIGYVGDTGNAGAGNCHLHFAIWTIDDPKRDWNGTNINPYPLLKNGVESNGGR